MRADAAAQLRDPATSPAESPTLAAMLVLLPQLIAARTLVWAEALSPAAARRAMRSDFATGYLFGLCASGGDPVAAVPGPRERRETLLRLHAVMFGTAAALDLDRRWATGAGIVVGARFGDGLLAAEADLAAFCGALADGSDAPSPTGLLLCLDGPDAAGGWGGQPPH
jgi:hypothetical protein